MQVVLRAFDEKGYHKDIAILSDVQVHMINSRIEEKLESIHTGLIGVGVGFVLQDFPEVERLEIVIKE